MAISKAFITIADGSVDPDSPIDAALMTGLRDNDIHLREWLGLGYYAGAVENHDHDGANSKKAKTLAPSATAFRAFLTNGAGNDVWGTLADMFRAEVSSRNLGVISNLAVGGTLVTTINLGSVVAGDRILVTSFFGYTGGTGAVKATVSKNSGTASIICMDSASSLFSTSTNDTDGNCGLSGIIKVTVSGTLTLQLLGYDSGTTADIAINFGQLHGIVLVGG